MIEETSAVRPSRTLTAYAFLSQASGSRGDLLQGLAPLFRPIAKQNSGKPFDAKDFSHQVALRYGFQMHPRALEDFAPRLAEAGVLFKEQSSPTTHSYRYAYIDEEFTQLSEADVSDVIARFTNYASPLLRGRGIAVTDQELEEALLSALTNFEFIDTILKPTTLAPSGKKLIKAADKRDREPDSRRAGRARLEVLCAGFVLHCYRDDRATYDLLGQIVAGALITEVVLEFQTPSLATDLKNLTVVLDCPFLMSLLDLGAPEATIFAKDIVKKLGEHGASLATYRHSIDEMRDNLKGTFSATAAGQGHGATARRLAIGTFATYARAIQGDPGVKLQLEGIAVKDLLANERWFQRFTQQEEDDLEHALGTYDNPKARQRDAASIAATIRFRAGARASMGRFDTAKLLFVTENPRLVSNVTRFLSKKDLYREGEVPPAITDRYLSGLLWALYGGKATELAPKLLLANCAAALEPSSDLLVKIRKFIMDLTPDQAALYSALLTTDRASQHLVEITLGESQLLTVDSAPAVLQQLKSTLIEKEHIEAQQEKDLLEEHYGKQISELNHKRADASDLAQSRDAERLLAESRAAELQEQNRRLQEEISRMAQSAEANTQSQLQAAVVLVSKRLRRIHMGLGIGAGICSAAIGVLASLNVPTTWQVVAWIATVLVTGLGFWKVPDMLFGGFIARRSRQLFGAECLARGLNSADPRFDVDIESGRVTPKLSSPADPARIESIASESQGERE